MSVYTIAPLKRWSVAFTLACGTLLPFAAVAQPVPDAREVLFNWNRMVLELVRHTPTYSPPVASRTFGYLGALAYEVVAGGREDMATLSGQLNAMPDMPHRDMGVDYDEAVMMHAALSRAVDYFFYNTGPTGQRAMTTLSGRMGHMVTADVDPNIAAVSAAHGEAIWNTILEWSKTDGGAEIGNLGFPRDYALSDGPQYWVPTSSINLQQTPLLPEWGNNRPFAMPDGAACPVSDFPPYSEEIGSPFYAEVEAVYAAVNGLDDEEELIARFWSDDPMLSPTPPGHWVSIALQVLRAEDASLEESVDLFARLGIGLADSFIGCWHEKYQHDLVRPVTYIQRLIDPDWKPILITPPFPEYPSGHSTQSGAAAAILEAHFGPGFAFADATHETEGMDARTYNSFRQAAEEAAISRLYGGIHYPLAIAAGLDQGLCIAQYTTALITRTGEE